jgi:hypothetical protein
MRKTALAGLGIVALVFAPWAAADVPGITQFVGSWYAHEEGLDIQPNGTGRETYADKSTCRDVPAVGCGKTCIVDFTLTSVSGDTATGAITAASNPRDPIGGPVTIKLVAAARGFSYGWRAGTGAFRTTTATTTPLPGTATVGRDEVIPRSGRSANALPLGWETNERQRPDRVGTGVALLVALAAVVSCTHPLTPRLEDG